VIVYVLTEGEMELSEFLDLYSPLSQPLHLIFFLLTIICTVSVLDRYDLAQFDFRQLQMMLSFRSSGIAIVIYFLVLIITLVTTRLDDKISLYQHNATIFNQLSPQELDSEISTWKALNACRSVGVILGWLLISFRPNTDLYKHIKKLGIYRPDQLGSSTLKM